MENKLLDKFSRTFSVELPYADTLDDYLDQVIPIVRPWGEDLWEDHFYVDKPWLEFRDDIHFHKAVLHFFNEGGEYLRSVDGNVSSGGWRYLEGANKILIEHGGGAELFDLAFMDGQFFILDKHGDQRKLGQRKYFVMVWEPAGKHLEWRDVVELLFNKYRSNNNYYVTLAVIVVLIIAVIVIYSLA